MISPSGIELVLFNTVNIVRIGIKLFITQLINYPQKKQ